MENSVQSWHRRLVFCHHLITLSALASTFGGIVKPICFAAFKLIHSSNFVGCSTGSSAGFVPFRQILSVQAFPPANVGPRIYLSAFPRDSDSLLHVIPIHRSHRRQDPFEGEFSSIRSLTSEFSGGRPRAGAAATTCWAASLHSWALQPHR